MNLVGIPSEQTHASHLSEGLIKSYRKHLVNCILWDHLQNTLITQITHTCCNVLFKNSLNTTVLAKPTALIASSLLPSHQWESYCIKLQST